MMEGAIEDDTVKTCFRGLPGVHVRAEIAQAAKPRGLRLCGTASLGYLNDVWRHIDADDIVAISGQLEAEVAVATADLYDRLRRVRKHAFHELVGVERA